MKPGTRQAPIETCATQATQRDIISDRTELQTQRTTAGGDAPLREGLQTTIDQLHTTNALR